MYRPSADEVDAIQARPARGDDASEAGPSAGNLVPHGGIDPFATSSTTVAAATAANLPHHVNHLPEQDHFMLVTNVICIMRRVLPMHAKISDDAKEMMQACMSKYINLIMSPAREQRMTITAKDMILAMGRLGFDSNVDPLHLYLWRYRKMESLQRIGLRGEHFPIITNHSHMPIGDTNRTPTIIAQPLLMRSPQPPSLWPPPPPSSLVLQPTVPPPCVNNLLGEPSGADYLLGLSEGGDGSGTSSFVAPPMPNFFP